jgi:hypothetical protein
VVTKRGFEIIELPINTNSILGKKYVFSGGGYFRAIPKWHLSNLFKTHNYVMTYFHPRDFDNNQPQIPGLSLIRKIKCYYGINTCLLKLDEIIEKNKFTNIRQIENEIVIKQTIRL